MIIGLTGKNGAGKGEVAKILEESGFAYRSLSDAVRDEVKKRGKKVTRENLIAIGRELRERFGPGILAERVLAQLEIDKNYIIDSIRNPAEAEALRRRADFRLIEVMAPEKTRFSRVKTRARENDPSTLPEFRRLEALETKSRDPNAQRLIETARQADFRVSNEGSLEQLRETVRGTIAKLAASIERPSWDDYFMAIARVVALRSNCMKRKVAAVIVKDRRIIATGYNGTPRGIRNCNEGGCPRCNGLAQSGQGLEDCYCSHGEENAIVQSAYHGVRIQAATLYTTFSPCLLCTKMIINSGLAEVVYNADYPLADTALKLLREAGVEVRKHSP